MDPTSAPPDPPIASKLLRRRVLRAVSIGVSLGILGVIWFRSRGYRPLDRLDAAAGGACLADGAVFGEWKSEFSGFGCNSIVDEGGKRQIRLLPKRSEKAGETHAALVVGPSHGSTLDLRFEVTNRGQLRKGSAPNPWEVGWVVWGYQDRQHFYYFALKPNGWELGKVDPAFIGGQRFLASGEAATAKIGQTDSIHIRQDGATMVVQVDGREMTRFEDTERPYPSGRIGVYCEDADVSFGEIEIRS